MVTKTKKTSKAKTAKRKKNMGAKGNTLVCSDCGLVLSVDERCGCPDLSGVLCCGEPMKRR